MQPEKNAQDPRRFARQQRLAEVGVEGQRRLSQAHALVVGVGALGSQIAELLCRAGVGRLTLVDPDIVDISNLQRQCLYDESDVGQPKVLAAQTRLLAINSGTKVTAHCTEFDHRFLSDPGIAEDVDVLLDGLDQLEARLLLNEQAQLRGIPYVYGAALGMEGCCFAVRPGEGACLHCLLQSPVAHMSQATCAMAGVLGPTIAMVAAMQVTEAIKLMLGQGQACSSMLRYFNLWENVHLELPVEHLHDCAVCGAGARETESSKLQSAHSRVLCGREALQLTLRPSTETRLASLAVRYASKLRARSEHHLEVSEVHDGRELRLTFFNDGRLIVDGSRELAVARAVLPPVMELL